MKTLFLSVAVLLLSACNLGSNRDAAYYYQKFREDQSSGYGDAQPTQKGVLAAGGTTEVALTLEPGSYRILGACDSQCADMDFILRDGREVVGEDELTDSFPLIDIEVPRLRTYSLEIEMFDCRKSDCEYMVGVLRNTKG